MNSQLQHPEVSNDNFILTESIGVKIDGLSDDDTAKIKKILQMTVNRNRKYHFCDQHSGINEARILITADQNPAAEDGVIAVTFGIQDAANPHHLHPPLISIRVLRILDVIQIRDVSSTTVEPAGTEPESVASEAKAVTTTQSIKQSISSIPEPDTKDLAVDVAAGQTLNYRVLIVDDSVLIHKALDIELEAAPFGFARDYAESGEDCLALTANNEYDLIFLDVMMPGIDGFETCSELRKNPKFKKTPIIMLSAKTSPLDEVKGVMAGCTTYLSKPIKHEDFQKLLGRMSDWLENFKAS